MHVNGDTEYATEDPCRELGEEAGKAGQGPTARITRQGVYISFSVQRGGLKQELYFRRSSGSS